MAATVSKSNSEYVENEINNVSCDAIRISEDKLKLRLIEYEKSIIHSSDWIGAFGIVVSIGLSLLTASFMNKLGLSGEEWHLIFVVILVVSIIYFVYSVIKAFKRFSIDDLIKSLKK